MKEEPMDCPIGTGYVLYTGGCGELDLLAEELGRKYGFQVEVKIGPRHLRAKTITPLPRETLIQANPYLHHASKSLDRPLNMTENSYARELFQRNVFIVKDVRIVYAFGELNAEKNQVKGGTGWSVQLALDLNKEVYVYDIPSKKWYQPFFFRWNGEGRWVKEFGFQPLHGYPTLHKSSAIIGTRYIGENTKQELRDLFRRTFCLDQDIQQLDKALQGLRFKDV